MPGSQPTRAGLYPSISYEDARAAIDWLCRVFGFEEQLVVPGPRRVRHSPELSFGDDAVIMVGSPRPEQGRLSAIAAGGVTAAFSLWVQDPDAHYEHAKAAGAKIVSELKDEEYGARGYMAKDPEGQSWYFGNYRPGDHW